ncbi:MAG: hypothetical protein ACTSW3_01195, partial [Promethearchaeota archaeon]
MDRETCLTCANCVNQCSYGALSFNKKEIIT